MKIEPIALKEITDVGSKFCQLVNKPSKLAKKV